MILAIDLFKANVSLSAFACSLSTIETAEQCVKYCSKVTKTPNDVSDVFLCLYCYCRTDFTYCSGVSIVDFEQLNVDWVHLSTR